MADTDDLEYSALPITNEIEPGDEVLLVRDGTPIRFTGTLPTENGVSDAVAEAEAARDAALAYGNATVKATWTEAAALTGLTNGAIVLVVNTDTGTHASVSGDVGSVSGQTPNSGVFRYSTSLAALVRIAVLESAVAQAWAESTTAPGAAGTKSAKSWVNYLLGTTGMSALLADIASGTSNIVAVGTDLLLGAASKIAAVGNDLALGASSLIGQAPAKASAAASSAAAAAASAASISDKVDSITEAAAALVTKVTHGRPRSSSFVTSGTGYSQIGQFAVVSAKAVTHREYGGLYEGYNPSGSSQTVTLCRAARNAGTGVASKVGTETATLTLPAGAYSVAIPDSMIWQAGDLIGEIFAPGAIGFVTSAGADDGGWYGAPGATSFPFTDASLDTTTQLQRRIITKKVDELPGAPIEVNLLNADRITWASNSFWAAAFVLQDKAPISIIGSLTDWNVESFSLSGSTFVTDNGSVKSRANAIRLGTIEYGNLTYTGYRSTITVFALGTNDVNLSITIGTLKDDHGREVFELATGLGSLVAFAAPHPTNYGNGNTNLYKQLAEQLGGYFINYRMYAKRVGFKEMNQSNASWLSGHPNMRANKFMVRGSLEWMDTLGRPRMSVKIFRPRATYVASLAGGVVGSVADLYYRGERTNFYRAKKWKELSVGHYAIDVGKEKYWDELQTGAPTYHAVNSEYLALMNSQAVPFTDYALVEFVTEHLAKHMSETKFVMNDVGATIYVPSHLGGSLANDTPVGAWVALTGSAGSFDVPDTILRAAMRYDKLPVLIVKSGSFNLTQSPKLQYRAAGPAKRSGPTRDVRKHATGAQLLANTTFPTTGALTGWTTSGTVTAFAPSDAPPGLAGAAALAAGASITSAPFTVTPSAYEDLELEIRVLARRNIATYSSANGYPGTSPVTSDTFDLTRLKVGVTTPAGTITTWDWLDMGWDESPIRVLVPEGVTSMTVTISADDAIDVAEVRVGQFV